MSMTKPAVVIIPGAWHVPAHYETIAESLEAAGHEVEVPPLTSVGAKSDTGHALQDDAVAIADTLQDLVATGKDVVLVGHSYGGLAGTEAVGILFEERDSSVRSNNAGRIRRIVFLTAHVVEKGQAALATSTSGPYFDTNDQGMMTYTSPHDRYYNDISPEEAEPALALMEPIARSALASEAKYSGWRDYGIPCTYIKCSKDVAMSSLYETYISRLMSTGVDMSVETIDAAHSPFWSAPNAVVDIIRRAAQ